MTIEAPSAPSITIAIQPFDDLDAGLLLEVRRGIEKAFGPIDIVVLEPCELPAMAYYPPRGRYRAEKLLQYLDSVRNRAHTKILGLTSKDISTTKGEHVDWGIFGFANLNSPACVVSTFRLKSGQPSEELFVQRVRRVVNHELGHTFGLLHCDQAGCLMRDAMGSIKTVDDGTGEFCIRCTRHIRQALGRGG
jgi:archaemetzincin